MGRVEPSFSSKLVATIRPEMPVYDSIVRNRLGIANPRHYKSAETRLADAEQAYDRIECFYACTLPTEEFAALKDEFDRCVPQFAHFTATKKLDILLWQWRKE
jgi:hypothetical protein